MHALFQIVYVLNDTAQTFVPLPILSRHCLFTRAVWVRGGVEHILRDCTEFDVKSIVITSSGGSTNPKDGEPPIKNELDHWSDPEFQISQGKFSPAAKTLMDRAALAYAEKNPAKPKVVVFNPNLILGRYIGLFSEVKKRKWSNLLFV